MKRKRGGATFAARALSSMTKVVSGNSTPKPLSAEEIKKKEQEAKEQKAKELEEKEDCASKKKR
jgi:transcription antitermination factor NusG